MDRVQFIEHKGKKILQLDLSGCRADEVIPVIEHARTVIRKQPPRSLYTLTNVTGAGFNNAVTEALKQFAAHNKPYVAAAAVVGISGLNRIIYNAVMKFTGRTFNAAPSLDEAKDWLASR